MKKTEKASPCRIAIGSDHAACDVKPRLVEHLRAEGYEVADFGTYTPDSCDYPVFADRVCSALTDGSADSGILICGTGIGMSIAANKHKGIIAAHCTDLFSAQMAREHNGANVICMGARISSYEDIEKMTDVFLTTSPLDEEKHVRRRAQLKALDER